MTVIFTVLSSSMLQQSRESNSFADKSFCCFKFRIVILIEIMLSSAIKLSTKKFTNLKSVSVTANVSAVRNFATYKTSTGLVGLAVDPNGRETLQDLSAEILSTVKVIYCSLVTDMLQTLNTFNYFVQ